MKKKNLRIYASLVSLMLSGNVLALTSANGEAYVEDGSIYKANVMVGSIPCDKYVVQKGETYLDIARKINRYYKESDGENRIYLNDVLFSQLLAKMNINLLTINPGDFVYFPDTSMESNKLILSMNGDKEANYEGSVKPVVQETTYAYTDNSNNAHLTPERCYVPEKKDERIPLNSDSVLDLLTEIYGENGYIDKRFGEHIDTIDLAFAEQYLEQLGLDDKYVLTENGSTIENVQDGLFDLTEWLPLPSELDESQSKTR